MLNITLPLVPLFLPLLVNLFQWPMPALAGVTLAGAAGALVVYRRS